MTRAAHQKGFTFFEFLILVTVIGILSAVVLASLNAARNQSFDSSIKSNLATIKIQSTMVYDLGGASYAQVCSHASIAPLLKEVGATCTGAVSSWAVSAPRPPMAVSPFWCADSTGRQCGTNTTHTGTACGVCVSSN